MTNTIEATANSLKLSYLRFVSDSASGLLLVVVLVTLDSKYVPFAVVPNDPAVRIWVGVAAVLLATPVGLLINGASHFMIGGVQTWLNRRCFVAQGWPIADSRNVLLIDQWREFFQVTTNDWPRVAHEINAIFETLMPHLAGLLDHVRALERFCRSIAFLALVTAFIAVGELGTVAAFAVLLGIAARLMVPIKFVQILAAGLVIIAFVSVCIVCVMQSVLLAATLFLIASGFLLLAGMLEFFHCGKMMSFVYQLLVEDGGSFKITPTEVRRRLLLSVRPSEA